MSLNGRFRSVIIEGDAVIQHFPPDWDSLVANSASATPFQTTGWYRAWIEEAASMEGATPLLLLAYTDHVLSSAVALQILNQEQGNKRLVVPLSFPWADYHDMLTNETCIEAVDYLGAMIKELGQDYNLRFDEIKYGGVADTVLSRLGFKQTDASPVAAIDLTDKEHIQRILDSNEHKRKWQRLKRSGDVTCTHYQDQQAIRERVAMFIEMHRKQWEGREDTVAPFDGGYIDATFHAMIKHMAPQETLMLTELTLNNNPIAMYWGFFQRQTYYGYRTTFDHSFFSISPGHLMLRCMIQDFVQMGLHKLDLMRGNYAYKHRYTNHIQYNKRFEQTVD